MEAGSQRQRSVNERLRDLNEPFAALLGTYEIACECSAGCDVLIEVPAPVYVRVRSGEELVVHPGHVRGATVVASRDGWAVVQK